jgi:long-chain acyl-CoA synthetase
MGNFGWRATLAGDLAHFLIGAGIAFMEGWDLTETVGPITLKPPGGQRIRSVGLPLPGCAVRVTDDGEAEVQGHDAFRGYRQDPESST